MSICDKVDTSSTLHAYYSVQFENESLKVDAETALSLILQYLYYLALDGENNHFNSYRLMLPELLSTPHKVVIGVGAHACVNARFLRITRLHIFRDLG